MDHGKAYLSYGMGSIAPALTFMKTIGLHPHRLHPDSANPREVAFAAEWDRANGGEQERHPYFTPLVHHIVPNATQRDLQVAATVVQWLGTNVGMGFLREVIEKSPEIKKQLV